MLFDLNDSWTLYASQSRIFQPQGGRLAGGGQIAPREGRQVEAGIKGSLLDGRLNATAAVYRMQDTNRALADPADAAFVIPAGKVRSEGFEAEVVGSLSPRWDVAASYAYMRSKYLQGTVTQTGTDFSTMSPRHSVNLWARYRVAGPVAQGLELGAGVRAVSEFYDTLGTVRWRAGGYGVWSVYAAYPLTPGQAGREHRQPVRPRLLGARGHGHAQQLLRPAAQHHGHAAQQFLIPSPQGVRSTRLPRPLPAAQAFNTSTPSNDFSQIIQ